MARIAALFHGGHFGAAFIGAADAVAGAERYAAGDLAGATKAWRPMLSSTSLTLQLMRDTVGQAYDRVGDPALADRADAPSLEANAPMSLAFVRAAVRASVRNDCATARRYAQCVIDKWEAADEKPPAVDRMKKLIERCGALSALAQSAYPPRVLDTLEKVPTWAFFAAYLAFWLVVAVVVRNLLRRWLARIASSQKSEVTEVLAASLPRPAAVGVFLVAVAAGVRFLPVNEARLEAMHRLFGASLAVLGVVVIVRVVLRLVDAYGRSNPDLQSSAGIGKALTTIVGICVSALLVSDALGISLAPALTALGVGSLAVALALQDTLSNFFSGLYLLVDKPIRPGDLVRVDPYEGYVESIGWRSTHLRTLANNRVIIPNGTLSKAIITNYSQPTALVQSNVRIDVGAEADVDRVEDFLTDEARRATDIPGIAAEPAATVSFTPGFSDGLLGFTVFFHAQTFAQQYGVQNALRKRIANRLKKEGVPLPLPPLAKAVSLLRRD